MKRRTYGGGRDGEERIIDQSSSEVGDGWFVVASEVTVDWSKAEQAFDQAFAAMTASVKAAEAAGCWGFAFDYPEEVVKKISVPSRERLTHTRSVLIPEGDEEFDMEEERFFVHVRRGCSVTVTTARCAEISAPSKSCRSGASLRGYAATMRQDPELLEDKEFYDYIVGLLGLTQEQE